jgi:hypothetical protein
MRFYSIRFELHLLLLVTLLPAQVGAYTLLQTRQLFPWFRQQNPNNDFYNTLIALQMADNLNSEESLSDKNGKPVRASRFTDDAKVWMCHLSCINTR